MGRTGTWRREQWAITSSKTTASVHGVHHPTTRANQHPKSAEDFKIIKVAEQKTDWVYISFFRRLNIQKAAEDFFKLDWTSVKVWLIFLCQNKNIQKKKRKGWEL